MDKTLYKKARLSRDARFDGQFFIADQYALRLHQKEVM